MNDACNIDLENIIVAFQASPGVDPKKANTDWIKNHYRWIVWKLAMYERRFPAELNGALTPNQVLLQLKFRYDFEINRGIRSALRKIYEKDDFANKTMILCIANIIQLDEDKVFMELTDGWYSISCIGSRPFVKSTRNYFHTVGTKLITFGAELINHNQACSPLEAPSPNDPDTGKFYDLILLNVCQFHQKNHNFTRFIEILVPTSWISYPITFG